MILRGWLKHTFSKAIRNQRLIELDRIHEKIRNEYNLLMKKQLNADVHAQLQDKLVKIDQIAQQKMKIRRQQQNDAELNIVKQYLRSKVVEPIKEQQSRYMPAGLTLNKLENKNSSVLLIGIDKHNQEHGFFVQDLVNRLEIKLLMTQISPDWPYFIKTSETFEKSWKQFVTLSSQYSFYLNPTPQTLSHLLLDHSKIPLFKNTLLSSSCFSQLTGICIELNLKTNQFQTNSFLCGLSCPKIQNMLCFDYPMLKQREYQALTMSIQSLRELFSTYLYNVQQGTDKNFDPRLLYYQKMLKPKIRYMAQVIKLGSLMMPKTIAICDLQYSHFICEQWKHPLPQNKQIFNFSDQKNLTGEKKRGFLQHLEKLIILDVVLNPMISDFFIKHKVLPYRCQNFIGKEQLLPSLNIIWDFYMKKYKDAIKNNQPIEYSKVQQKF